MIDFVNKQLGLYDSSNGESVVADKVFDVSALCPDSKQCIIKYATVVRGRIVQICNLYESGKDMGATLHYHINELTEESLAEDEVFRMMASIMGAPPAVLSKIIFSNQ